LNRKTATPLRARVRVRAWGRGLRERRCWVRAKVRGRVRAVPASAVKKEVSWMLDTATGCAITTHSTFCSHGGSGVEPMYRQYAPSETPSCNACKGVRVLGFGLVLD